MSLPRLSNRALDLIVVSISITGCLVILALCGASVAIAASLAHDEGRQSAYEAGLRDGRREVGAERAVQCSSW